MTPQDYCEYLKKWHDARKDILELYDRLYIVNKNYVFDNFMGECFVCNKKRKYKNLNVRSINIDECCTYNMKYCNDVLSCIENAHQVTPQEVNEKCSFAKFN